ncbi:MAG: TolC family protein, partial [Gemmataceae bacterium]
MTARQWGRRRFRRRRPWKTAGAILLGLMSSSLGCQGIGDLLRHNVSNDVPAATSTEGHPPRTIATPVPVVAAAPVSANSGILQVGATKIVPLGGGTDAPASAPSIVRAAFSQGDPDGPDEAERNRVRHEAAAPSGHTTGDSPVASIKTETESAERKWTAAPVADEDKAGAKGSGTSGQDKGYQVDKRLPSPTEGMATPTIPTPKNVRPLSLAAALAQAGAENPVIAIALQAVQAAQAEQLLARVLLVPSVNVGADYGQHTGPVQSSFGAIRKVNRQLLDYGLGTYTDAANTIKIPGLLINAALTDAIFQPRAARYAVANRRFQATATRNDIFLEVSTTYLTLMNAEARLAIIRQSARDFEEVARLTASFAKRGKGRQGNADRAEADLLAVRYEEQHAQQEVAIASADLSQLLNLDPSTRLVTGDIPLQVVQFVDPKVPLPKLLELAERNHPGILAAAANIRASQVRVRQEKSRPLLPSLWMGFSATEFGGGAGASTNGTVFNPHTGQTPDAPTTASGGQTIPVFGNFAGRVDVDVIAYWTLQNMGFGNLAHIRERRAQLGQAEAARLHILNEVREQVSVAFNKSAEHFRAIGVQRRRVQDATQGFQEDLIRILGGEGLPIEVLDNATRLREAREALLAAVIGFDRAQFQLFVALGQPPTLVVEDDKPPVAAPEGPAVPANMPPPEQLPP